MSRPFGLPLKLTIISQAGNEPIDGGQVTFNAPVSGASTTFAPTATVVISTGQVTLSIKANNSIGGPYEVMATVRGANPVSFSLTNNPAVSETTPGVYLPSLIR